MNVKGALFSFLLFTLFLTSPVKGENLGDFVLLKTTSGESLAGSIVDIRSDAVHLAGARINRWIVFSQLTEASRAKISTAFAPGSPAGKNDSLSQRVRDLQSASETHLFASPALLTQSYEWNPYSFASYHPYYFGGGYACRTPFLGSRLSVRIHF